MSNQVVLQAGGLNTNSNEFQVPAGALVKAQNCVMLAPGVVASRKGFANQSYTASASFNEIAFYGDTPMAHLGTDTLSRDTGSAWEDYAGSYEPADATLLRMKFMEATQNLYFTTTKGIYRLDAVSGTPAMAGGPRTGQIFSGATTGSSGFLPDGSSVAYRVVFGIVDANGNRHTGPVSGRFVVSNTSGGTRNVALVVQAPNGTGELTTKCYWQLYRSRVTDTTDGTDAKPGPNDELALCQEAFFTSSQIGATISITDTSPDSFLGAYLYTNEVEGEGILQSNDAPPYAKDMCWWDGRAWYANTRRYRMVALQMLGAGAGSDGFTGVRLNDQITINGTTYTAGTSYDAGTGRFLLYTASLDAAVNVQTTTQSLVNLINATAGTELAQVTSASVNDPGKFTVSSTLYDAQPWYVTLVAGKVSLPIGALVRTGGNLVTATTAVDHGLETGDTVRIDPVSAADANFAAGIFTVTRTGATTFTYAQAGSNVASTAAYTEHRLTPAPSLAWSPPPPPTVFDVAVGDLSRVGSNVVCTTLQAHGLSVGMLVPIEPVTQEDANFPALTALVTSVPTTTSFTYVQSGASTVSTTAYQSGARVASDNAKAVNGLAWSKVGEPEAVPFANATTVGVPDKQILRIVPLGSLLFVFKQEGVWVVSGTAGDYRVDILDPTVHTYAPDSVVSVSNRVYALTNQGVVATTSGGCSIISTPIEQELFQYFGASLSNVRLLANATAMETDRQYVLWFPFSLQNAESPFDDYRAYVWSTIANAWTTWNTACSSGRVRGSDDVLYIGSVDQASTQSNTKTQLDYADRRDTLQTAATGWSPATLELSISDAYAVAVGDAVAFDADNAAVVTGVSADGLVLTLSGDPGVPTLPVFARIYRSIPCGLQFRTLITDPTKWRSVRELHCHFRLRNFYGGDFVVTTDEEATGVNVAVPAAPSSYVVDLNTYPGAPINPVQTRIGMPQEVAHGAYHNIGWSISEAFALWWLNGISLVYETGSERTAL